MTTKEKITKEALTLFAEKGYKGTSVKNIADAVGIKDASLYNHFKSKQEIFDAFADKSEAANESRELDEKDFGNIIKEEIDRINAKRGNPNGKKAE